MPITMQGITRLPIPLYGALNYTNWQSFPDNERGAQALYEVATHASNAEGKIKGLEHLRASYNPVKFRWSESGMAVLYDLYLEAGLTDKAMQLAKTMGTDEGWRLRQTLAAGMKRVNALLKEKNYQGALKQLTQLKAPQNSRFVSELIVLKATTIHKNGQTQAAYDSLIAVESKSPDDLVRSALMELGAALGKSNEEINNNIWQARTN